MVSIKLLVKINQKLFEVEYLLKLSEYDTIIYMFKHMKHC